MRAKFLILLLVGMGLWHGARSQTNTDYTQSRILILLDESSSMIDLWNNDKPKFKVADTLIMRLMDSIYAVNNEVEFSLRAFGHQHTVDEHDCQDTRNEVPFSRGNRAQMTYRLSDIHPLGVTPLAYALQQAAENDLVDETHNAYSIILITDGGESCGGNICDVMKTLVKHKVYFKPYIVSLEDVPELKSEYTCMGNYLQVTKPNDVGEAITTIVDAFRPMLNLTKKDYVEIKKIAAKRTDLEVSDYDYKHPPKIQKKEPIVADVLKPKPTPPTKDSVVTNVTKHTISVGEEPERAQPVLLSKIKNLALADLPANKPGKRKPHAYDVPDLPPFVFERPEPTNVAKVRTAPLTDLETKTKRKIKFNTSFHPELPEVKYEQPEQQKITALPSSGYADMAIKQKRKIKFTNGFHPDMPEFKSEKPEVVKMSNLPALAYQDLEVKQRWKIKFNKNFHPAMPQAKPVEVERPLPTHVTAIATTGLVSLPDNPSGKIKFKKYKTPPMPQFPVIDEVVMPEKQTAQYIPHAKLHTYLTLWSADKYLAKQKMPQLPIMKTLLNPVKQAPPEQMTVLAPGIGYTTEHEDAKETSLAIYFTDGKGKLFTTSPFIKLIDPAGNTSVKEFFRTCSPGGEPDAQNNIPPGKYNMVITRKTKMMLQDIEILPNKKNKVYVKVKPCSLTFEYAGAPGRPVKEYSATVTERNVPNGKVITQKCTEELQYNPANYHIVVNTRPEMVFNVDLDFDEEKPLVIFQAGFAKFTTSLPLRDIKLSVLQGEKFLNFYSLDMNDPAKAHFQLQPGTYQAIYQKGPANYSSTQKVVTFTIISNEETEVILK